MLLDIRIIKFLIYFYSMPPKFSWGNSGFLMNFIDKADLFSHGYYYTREFKDRNRLGHGRFAFMSFINNIKNSIAIFLFTQFFDTDPPGDPD